jgi:hypothetical protein
MIDSIHLRLHNLQKYRALFNQLKNHSDRDIYEETASMPDNKNTIVWRLKVAEYKSDGRTLMRSDGHKLTSSHYKLYWSLPWGESSPHVDLNFSIPKMLYGTNIIQFVKHKTEPFNLSDIQMNDYKWNQDNTHKRLMHFLRHFFERTFFDVEKIDFNDIEVMRFDICWNQYFNSKDEALNYLSYQKNVRKKHLRISSKNQTGFATSVFFSTRDYGCKIYHKGSEYRSGNGERKEHLKANRNIKALKERGNFFQKAQVRLIPFDVEKLEAHADKILRYEITFRRSYISKIFRKKVFRHNHPAWQYRMKYWKECHRIYQYATAKNVTMKHNLREFWLAVYQGRVNLNDKEMANFASYYAYKFEIIDISKGLNKIDRAFYKWWLKKRDHYLSFRLAVSDEVTRKNQGKSIGSLIETDLPFEARFSPLLLSRCFKVFNDFRDHFEIKEKVYLSDAQRRLDMYNNNIEAFNQKYEGTTIPGRKKILPRGVKSIIKLLEHDTLDGLVAKGIICRKTAYNYEKKFEDLNFNLHTGSAVSIWNCRDFEEYHRSLYFDGIEKYLHNPIF